MIRSKFARVFVLSMCLSLFSAAAANAAVKAGGQPGTADGGGSVGTTMISVDPDQPVSSPVIISEDILKKQKEIDTYLFKEHIKEIEQKGITVTYTAPFEGYVEIGIMPMNKDNAEYLYGIFGRDGVKVAEGQLIAAMEMPQAAPDQAVQGNSAGASGMSTEPYAAGNVGSEVKNEAARDAAGDAVAYKNAAAPNEAELYTTTAGALNEPAETNTALIVTLGSAAAAVVLGGTAILLGKRKQVAR